MSDTVHRMSPEKVIEGLMQPHEMNVYPSLTPCF